ncbi:MAG: 3-dehydroquinate synthase, partial [Planctomycetales bacterium]|nr:3-dehydroquinate synthase [Planctomycetales bacterium]
AILNYGHTYCHALEAATGYTQILHGEGVAIGMVCASTLAEQLGMVDSQATQRQKQLLEKLGLPVTVPAEVSAADLLSLMWRDKKVSSGQLRFVLPTQIGSVELVESPGQEPILASIEANR